MSNAFGKDANGREGISVPSPEKAARFFSDVEAMLAVPVISPGTPVSESEEAGRSTSTLPDSGVAAERSGAAGIFPCDVAGADLTFVPAMVAGFISNTPDASS